MSDKPAIELHRAGHAVLTWRNVGIQIYAAEARLETVERATSVIKRLERTHPAGIGSIVVVAHSGKPPDEACRAAWAKQLREMKAHAILVLYEGTSLRASIVRAVVTGLALLSGRSSLMQAAATPAQGLPWFVGELDRGGASCGTVAEVAAAIAEARRLAVESS